MYAKTLHPFERNHVQFLSGTKRRINVSDSIKMVEWGKLIALVDSFYLNCVLAKTPQKRLLKLRGAIPQILSIISYLSIVLGN